jgi:hypothetical protein
MLLIAHQMIQNFICYYVQVHSYNISLLRAM